MILILSVQIAIGTEDYFQGLLIMDAAADYLRIPVFTENYLDNHLLITNREDALALAEMYMRLQKEQGFLDEKLCFKTICYDIRRALWIFSMSDQTGPLLTEYDSKLVISAKNGALIGIYVNFNDYEKADENNYIYIDK